MLLGDGLTPMRRICNAKRKNGEPCQGSAMRGSDKCRMHVGKRAAVVKLEQEARQQLARLDVAPVDDPLTQLAQVTGQVIAWKDRMAGVVNDLTSLRYSTEGGEQLRAELALWERALDRCERFLTAMARLEIDERLARISEAQANEIIVLITMIGDRLSFTPDQRRLALAAVEEYFAA